MGSEKEIEYPMDQAKEMLSNIPELRFYKNYIKTRLAGDFAFDIAEYITNLQKMIQRGQ